MMTDLSGLDLSKIGPISLIVIVILGLVFWFVRDMIKEIINTTHNTIAKLIERLSKEEE